MQETNTKRNLIQAEFDKRQAGAKKSEKMALIMMAGIGAIAILGLMASLPNGAQTNDDYLKVASSILLASWGYIKHLNMKANAQNLIIFNSLNKNEKTALSELEKIKVIENISSSSVMAMGGIILSTIPLVFMAGTGQMNPGLASTTGASILIATELFLKRIFKQENRFLKSHLPSDLIIPLEKKPYQRDI